MHFNVLGRLRDDGLNWMAEDANGLNRACLEISVSGARFLAR